MQTASVFPIERLASIATTRSNEALQNELHELCGRPEHLGAAQRSD